MEISDTQPQPHSKVIEDIWRKTLSAIPSDLGKLAYISTLRDPNSGRYSHYGLESVYSADEADVALRQSHTELFYGWLQKPLSQQKDDTEHYFRTVEGELETILENWKDLEPFRAYIPVGADEAARALFLDDLGMVLDLMLSELFPSDRASTAWPQP